MTFEERKKKLMSLPWQALHDLAIEKEIDEAEVNGKDKDSITTRLLSTLQLTDEEIDRLVDDYIYGNRITFTLWTFNRALSEGDYRYLSQLEGWKEPVLESPFFRNLFFLSSDDIGDRFEILYTYSKEYSYVGEDGHNASVWEQHRGCLWIGKDIPYIACISKHDKMTSCVVGLIAEKMKNSLTQINPPKAAIEKCIHYKVRSRVVLQGADGEKTIVSRSGGLTADQEEEISRIRKDRIDTSGSYIAEITDDISASVKYNAKKGSIGILKHLPTTVLFDWSQNAISVIFDEIDKLKGRPAKEIFDELGLDLKWPGFDQEKEQLNWFLTNIIAALDRDGEYFVQITDEIRPLLQNSLLFHKIPKAYCNVCDSYETPHCKNCGEPLHFNENGSFFCNCGAPLEIVCPEGHFCRIEYWYLPTTKLNSLIAHNIQSAFKGADMKYFMCVTGEHLRIVHTYNMEFTGVEIAFSDISCFSDCIASVNPDTQSFAVRLNEKCSRTCSKEKIEKCIQSDSIVCLPRIFYPLLPNYRPQPHKGGEYGDVSSEVVVGSNHFEMKGIIKKNTKNKGYTPRTDQELINEYLLSTSTEGEEIIRQFVEQGMVDSRCQLIAVIAPQYFDHSFMGTLRYLARLSHKKVVFIGLDEVCGLIEKNDSVAIT